MKEVSIMSSKKSFTVGQNIWIPTKNNGAEYAPTQGTIGGQKSLRPLRDKLSYYVFYNSKSELHVTSISRCDILRRPNLFRNWFAEEEVFASYDECQEYCNLVNSARMACCN